MRKLYIGVISFAAVVGVFLLYSQIGRTPPLETGAGSGAGGVADSNFDRFGDVNTIGKIGDIGIGTSEKANFVTRNKNGEIDGGFGFEVLLHKEGDLWELEKPYRNIYRPEFTCYMTADRGSFQVETAGDSTTTKDATFNGNVLIHIIPGSSSDIKETKIYLDDLVFLSDRSQLATSGPVTVISDDIRMVGTGMELIYNDVLTRLELFRIYDLESLLIKQLKTALEEPKQTDPVTQTKTGDMTTEPVEVAVAEDAQEPGPAQETEQNQYYKCVFSRNVFIDTQEELIYAAREVFINDIFWSKDPDEAAPAAEVSSENDANEPDVVIAQAVETDQPVQSVTDSNEPNEPAEQFVEIAVTCDSGFMIVPREVAIELEGITSSAQETEPNVLAKIFDQAAEKTILKTERIDYSMPNDDTFASGPTELIYYAEDSNATDPNQRIIPVRVTAQRQARFLTATNQVIFEGDCICTMPQKDLAIEKDLILSAPELIINLPERSSEQQSKLPDLTTLGPTELLFYVDDPNAVAPDQRIVPVKITAQKQAHFISATDQVIFKGDCICKMGSEEMSKDQSFELRSPMLTVNLPPDKTDQSFTLTDIVANGPAELEFYVDDITGEQGPNEPLPAKVVAQKQARFLSSSKQIVFEGSCQCTIIQENPNFVEEFILESEKMTVDLPKDTNDRTSPSMDGIEHLVAKGGVVNLAAIKKPGVRIKELLGLEPERVLGGIEIKCSRIDYNSQQGLFVATGPALVKLNNTEINDSNEMVIASGPGKEWWAVVDNCHDLQYSPGQNRIVANAMPGETLDIRYTTLEDGQYGPAISATAGHCDIKLIETTDGQTELSTLYASGGIDYQDDGNRFIGSELFFDHEKSLVTVVGNDTQPCYCNGTLVDGIEYNLKTREFETKIVAPGAVQIKKK